MAIMRMSASPFSSTRVERRTSNKLIFISCEGSVTEWEYFDKVINQMFDNIKSKVKIINILEKVLAKNEKARTKDEKKLASSSDPSNLLEKMDRYLDEHKDEFDFDSHENDEFWLIMDVDDHTSSIITDDNGKSNLDKWNEVLYKCREKNYKYAVSNPFFELWLLLHFDDISDADRAYAVTTSHSYETTNHFRNRLSALNFPLKKGKHIEVEYYNKSAIDLAVSRAEALDPEPKCDYPTALGTTVYRLVKSIAEIEAQYNN